MALGDGDALFAALDGKAAMRAGAGADIIAVTPIGEIVARFRTGDGVVGDFISRQTKLGSDGAGQVVKIGGLVRIGNRDLAGLVTAP
jgi:hypothetical protein